MRRAEPIDGLKRNWRKEKLLIDEKSRKNRQTDAEQATRRAQTIDGLKRNYSLLFFKVLPIRVLLTMGHSWQRGFMVVEVKLS